MNVLGKRIKSLREDNNLNQKELAKILNISNSTLSQYETGQRIPSDDVKISIAKYFDCSIDYLLGNSNIKNPYNEDDLPDDFNSPEEAMDFLLNKNVIMGFTGFDIHKLSDEEKTQYARDLLDHLKLLSLKYKK